MRRGDRRCHRCQQDHDHEWRPSPQRDADASVSETSSVIPSMATISAMPPPVAEATPLAMRSSRHRPGSRLARAANCELPPNTSDENPTACHGSRPTVAAAAPNTKPNGAAAAMIEAAWRRITRRLTASSATSARVTAGVCPRPPHDRADSFRVMLVPDGRR